MIKAIYFERYKKPLIAFCLLILGICLLNAKFQSDSWHQIASYFQEDEIGRESFEKDKKDYMYWDDASQENKSYKNYQEYTDVNLSVYQTLFAASNPELIPEAKEYNQKETYTTTNSDYSLVLLLLVPLAGFLLFFIDAKTGFNQFLFSLPVTKKELFTKKLFYIGGPILFIVLIGQALYATLFHSLIPATYMNATLGQMFVSVINYFFLVVLMFSASAFVGSMVGNLIFGPLTWFVFWIFMLFVPSSIYATLEISGFKEKNATSILHNLFITSIGKTGGHWWMSLIFVLLSAILLFWAYKKYQSISLENDGQYLLNKESRWPVWALMTSFSSLILGTYFFRPWYIYYMNLSVKGSPSIWEPISESLLILFFVAAICYVLVFFSAIKKRLSRRNTQNDPNQI
ncbi:ABC transporter permease [Candidatus Enterococcus ferrettii]|uniref:ABC transporter permease n=1 Tax=Candidatus Enterococcus ferrettii TaxID=2815324 RepID=A0ABV0EQU4_9ENTE|nr:ABC transporter permease [Enterococcus sp. 665A]MBO1341131.1 ABC transporter permease [Enterococcus sp. 665A]